MINSLIQEKIKIRENFFEDGFVQDGNDLKKISIIVVSHVIDTGVPYINTLNKYFSIEAIIPKQKSINIDFLDLYPKEKLLHINREDLKDFNNIKPTLDKVKKENKLIILDIGGYFSHIGNEIREYLGDRFVGIIEDTENGHQKYLKNREILHPVISVARSPLKENEDHLVGQSVVFSVDSLFREQGILLNNKKVGIIGFGKIGNGIVSSLKDKGCHVSIYDINPMTVIKAYSKGNNILTKNKILETSDIIFCSSGNLSIKEDEFKLLKTNVYIASVTSSDDELDFTYLKKNYIKTDITKYITKYELHKHVIYIINDGNAVNFLHGAVVDDFILLVQKEMVDCISYIISNSLENKIQESPEHLRLNIADLWLRYFLSIHI